MITLDSAAIPLFLDLFFFRDEVNEWFDGFCAAGGCIRALDTAEMSAEPLDFGMLSKAITKVKIEPNGKWHKKCTNVKMNRRKNNNLSHMKSTHIHRNSV